MLSNIFLILSFYRTTMSMSDVTFAAKCTQVLDGVVIRSACYWQAESVTGNNANSVGEQTCKRGHVDARMAWVLTREHIDLVQESFTTSLALGIYQLSTVGELGEGYSLVDKNMTVSVGPLPDQSVHNAPYRLSSWYSSDPNNAGERCLVLYLSSSLLQLATIPCEVSLTSQLLCELVNPNARRLFLKTSDNVCNSFKSDSLGVYSAGVFDSVIKCGKALVDIGPIVTRMSYNTVTGECLWTLMDNTVIESLICDTSNVSDSIHVYYVMYER